MQDRSSDPVLQSDGDLVPVNAHPPTARARTAGRAGRSIAALLALPILGAACEEFPGGISCTTDARATMVVTVTDSVTGSGLAFGTSLILQDGTYIDSIAFSATRPPVNDSVLAPINTYERAGTYAVRVRRPGYLLWQRDNQVVTRDVCHVRTERISVRLEPVL